MDAIAPDLPSEGTEAGLIAPATAGQVAADDPNSLLRAPRLEEALEGVEQQLAAGQQITLLRVEPGAISTESSSAAEGFEIGDVEPNAPERIAALIAGERKDVRGLEDVLFIELQATRRGEPEWYVQLGPEIDPPRTYRSPADGSAIRVG